MTRYIKSGTVNTVQEINSELERIATSQVDFLARDGETPNAMNANLDMNGKRILNLPSPLSPNEPVRVQDLPNFIAGEGNNLILITREEDVTLTAGQTVVTLTELTTTQTAYYISGQGVDQGRLNVGTDFIVTSTTQITLAESYPVGTIVTAVQNSGAGPDPILKSDVQTFDNIAEMKQAFLIVGDTVLCKRYYAGGDLVDGLLFVIVAGATGTDDGGSFHDLANGNQAELVNNTPISVKQFGAKGDGTFDDTNLIQFCINFTSIEGGVVNFPVGQYAISNKLILEGGIKYTGTAGGSSKIVKHPNFEINNPAGDVMSVSKDWDTATGYNGAANGVIQDLSFDEGNTTLGIGSAIALGHASNWVIERCRFFGMKFHGVDSAGSTNITVRDCFYFGTVGQSFNAFQADQATAGAIEGINPDDTPSDNIHFLNNYVTGASVDSLGPQSAAFHIHRSNNKNIVIDGNYIENCDFMVQTDGSFNQGIIITNNVALRGTVDGASATAIKCRSATRDLIIKGNKTFGYNLDVSLDHPTDTQFHENVIISDNNFNFAVNRSIFVNQAFRVQVHDNTIQGVAGDMVDAAIGMLGCNNFNVHDNNVYDPDGDGIVVGADAGGGSSSNGLVHSNQIVNGGTGLLCTASSSNVLFYSNRLSGTFATSEININENQSNVRNFGFQGKESPFIISQAEVIIAAGATHSVSFTATGSINGDIVTIGYQASDNSLSEDGGKLIFFGQVLAFQAGRIKVYNPTSSPITLEAGNYKAVIKSSRFLA